MCEREKETEHRTPDAKRETRNAKRSAYLYVRFVRGALLTSGERRAASGAETPSQISARGDDDDDAAGHHPDGVLSRARRRNTDTPIPRDSFLPPSLVYATPLHHSRYRRPSCAMTSVAVLAVTEGAPDSARTAAPPPPPPPPQPIEGASRSTSLMSLESLESLSFRDSTLDESYRKSSHVAD